MNSLRSEKSIGLKLQKLVEKMVLEPEQKKNALRDLKKFLQANRVSDVKSLRKAMDRFLGTILLQDEADHDVD